MNGDMLRESYYDALGTVLHLTCAEGSSLVELTLPGASPAAVDVDVSLQPRDECGLPAGPPVRVCRTTVRLAQLADGRRQGRFWLPHSLAPATARECHFRIIPVV